MKTNYILEVNGNQIEVDINKAYCVGYTGRDIEKTKEHIKELAEIGISEPEEIPMLYPVRTSSLMQSGSLEVLGNKTSGEAEIVLIFGDLEEDVYVTVGSDHTDRALEEVDINLSKQICDKPFAKKAWKLSEVIEHWDSLELSSEMYVDGKWETYQNDKITAILPYEEIKSYLNKTGIEVRNGIFYSGTVPLVDGFKYGSKFKMTFRDPIRNDEISMTYNVKNIERR